MLKISNPLARSLTLCVAAALLPLLLSAGCSSSSKRIAKPRYSHATQKMQHGTGARPLLWTGQDERRGGISESPSGESGQIGQTRVDYIGALNSDRSFAGSPAEAAELRLLERAGVAMPEEGDLMVEFANDPLDYFVRQMVGGFLGLNYVVSGQLTGTVTFKTETPIRKSQAMAVVRSILAQNGYAMKLIGGVFHIGTPELIARTEQTNNAGSRGERMTRVVPLAGPADPSLGQTLAAILPEGVGVVLSPNRDRLLLQANGNDIDEAEELVRAFVEGKPPESLYAIIYLNKSPPENVAAKLLAFFATQRRNGAELPFAVIPLEQRQALLVSASSKTAIENVRKVASQLDFGLEDEVTLRIIPLRNLAAADLAAQMTQLFQSEGGATKVTSETTGMSQPDIGQDVASEASYQQAGENGNPSQNEITERVNQAFSERPEAKISVDTGSAISIVADERNNVLLVRSSYRAFRRIREAVRALDVPLSQVVIEATIIEVKITDELKYGVQWFLSGSGFTMRGSQSTSQDDPGLAGFAATVEKLVSGISVNAVIDALDDVTDVSVISSPYLTVMNQKTARLVVGDQIPFATKSQSSSSDGNVTVTQDIEIKDTGVILEVQPTIRANDSIELRITNEVSSAELQSGVVNLTPTVTTRQITSDIIVYSGHTVLLGGLIQDRTVKQKTGIPLLRKTPLIGKLFEQTSNSDLRTEVVVMITPRVARSSSEIGQITNELRQYLKLPRGWTTTKN